MPRATVDITPRRPATRRGPVARRPQQRRSRAVDRRRPRRTAARPCCVLSFGGPEGPDDVMPFLENVTRGRGIPRERLEDVAEHYHHFGGVSPINDAEQGADRRPREGARGRRHRPAGLLGQPQLGALRRGHLAADGRRRHRARLRLRHLAPTPRSPAAGSTTRTSPGRASRYGGGPDRGEAAALLRRPRASCRPTPTPWPRRSPRCPTSVRGTARLVATAHSIPDVDGRRRRAATGTPTRPS